MNDITDRLNHEHFMEKLRFVVDKTSSKLGNDYFNSLAEALSEALQAEYVFIGEALDRFERVRTLAYWSENHFESSVEYQTRDTPCGRIMDSKITFFPDNLQQRFPDDPLLAELDVKSYLAIPFYDENGDPFGHVCVMSKVPMEENVYNEYLLEIISARLSAEYIRTCSEQRLLHMANHDPLTDLPNRVLFWDRLNSAISRSARQHRKFGIIFIDLDNFKILNDTFGHHLGDEYLKAIATRMQSFCRECDTLCRYGGDEFTVIVENARHPDDISSVATGLHNSLTSRSYSFDGHTFNAEVSIGYAIYPEHGIIADELLKKADQAMYTAKHRRSQIESAL